MLMLVMDDQSVIRMVILVPVSKLMRVALRHKTAPDLLALEESRLHRPTVDSCSHEVYWEY